jgi:hypothetical protein
MELQTTATRQSRHATLVNGSPVAPGDGAPLREERAASPCERAGGRAVPGPPTSAADPDPDPASQPCPKPAGLFATRSSWRRSMRSRSIANSMTGGRLGCWSTVAFTVL